MTGVVPARAGPFGGYVPVQMTMAPPAAVAAPPAATTGHWCCCSSGCCFSACAAAGAIHQLRLSLLLPLPWSLLLPMVLRNQRSRHLLPLLPPQSNLPPERLVAPGASLAPGAAATAPVAIAKAPAAEAPEIEVHRWWYPLPYSPRPEDLKYSPWTVSTKCSKYRCG